MLVTEVTRPVVDAASATRGPAGPRRRGRVGNPRARVECLARVAAAVGRSASRSRRGHSGRRRCAAANLALLRYAPPVGPIQSLRRVYGERLVPVFGQLGAPSLAAISVAAGVGEELLFRGALQAEIGLVPASLVFGALHWGGRGTVAFAAGTALLGLALGWLRSVTGGLLAPIVAHALYDGLVLAYIRATASAPSRLDKEAGGPREGGACRAKRGDR